MEGYDTTMGGYEVPTASEAGRAATADGTAGAGSTDGMGRTGRMDGMVGTAGTVGMAGSAGAKPTPAEESPLPTGRAGLAGLVIAAIGAWGGAVAYFGPKIGLGSSGARSLQWSTPHTVLNLAPGAAALVGGLMVVLGSRLLRGGVQRLGALLAFAAGGWFVLGPAVYPVFYGATAPGYGGTGHGPLMNLASLVGYGAGVGVVLCLLSGLAVAWSLPRIVWARRPVPEGARRQRAGAGLPLRNTEPAGI